jgi:membrane protein implicated in regulation of membrane protease activity
MQIRLTFFDVVLFAIMIIGFVIGIHQSIYYGVANSYWLFMLSSLAFLWLNQRMRNKKEEMEKNPENQTGKTSPGKTKSAKRK